MQEIMNALIKVLMGAGWTIGIALAGVVFRYFAAKAKTERGRWYAGVALQITNRLEGLDLTNEQKKAQGLNDLANAINKEYPFVKVTDERLNDILEEAVYLTHQSNK